MQWLGQLRATKNVFQPVTLDPRAAPHLQLQLPGLTSNSPIKYDQQLLLESIAGTLLKKNPAYNVSWHLANETSFAARLNKQTCLTFYTPSRSVRILQR